MARSSTRWSLRHSTQVQAHASPTTHAFRRGVGYLEYAPNDELLKRRRDLALHAGPHGEAACDPPANTPTGSQHLLKPPGGHAPMVCSFVSRPAAAWMPLHRDGKRLAFTAAYLASHGWKYLRAV